MKAAAARKGWRLGEALENARVSRTAYYSLVRRNSVLPRSIRALAAALGVSPAALLERAGPQARYADLLREARAALSENPEVSFDDVWHTLVLLEEPPIERLRRSLLRGRALHPHR